MAECEVDGPLLVVLGRFRGLCGWSSDGLGASVGSLGSLLWPLFAILGRSWASAGGPGPLLGPMLAVLGSSWGSVGNPGPLLGLVLAVWGCSWASAVGLGAYLVSLRLLLGPILAVLGRSVVLCWRSWADLGAYVGDLGVKNAKNMATLKICLFLERERDLWPRRRSGAALGSYLGGLGPLLEPMLAVLGRSWAYVGGLVPSVPDLGACWRF